MKTRTRFLSSTSLATLGILLQLGNAHAQVFVGSGQPSVEVDLDALNDLPDNGSHPGRAVRLHEPKRVAQRGQVVQYDAEYSDATTVVSGVGISRTALAAPDAPDGTLPPAKKVAHHRHHHRATSDDSTVTTGDLNRRSLTEAGSEGLNPEIARFDPAVMNSADLNRLQILCSAIPTSAQNPMQNASFSPAPTPAPDTGMASAPQPPAPMPPPAMTPAEPDVPAQPAPAVAPQAQVEPKPRPKPVRYTPPEPAAVVAPSPKVTTASLNQKELALDTLGNADIPPPVDVARPPSPPAMVTAEASETQRPIATPGPSQVAEQPLPTPTPDTQLAAIPAPPQPAMSGDVQPAAMAPAPTPHAPPGPLSDDDLKVNFQPGEAVIPSGELAKLDRIVDRLGDSNELRIELRAFATSQADSTSMARRVSLARALAIKSYLTSRGVSDERIDVRALGSSPTDASDRVDLFLMR